MPVNITRKQQQERLERNLKIGSAIIGGLGLAVLVSTLNPVTLGALLLGVGLITVITFPEETQEWVKWAENNPFIIGAAAFGATFNNILAVLLFPLAAYCIKLYLNKGISAFHQVKEQAQERMGPLLSIISWVTNKIAHSLSANEEPELQFYEIENIEDIEEPEIQFFDFDEKNIEPFTPLRIAAANSSKPDELTSKGIGIPMSQEDFKMLRKFQ